MQTAHPVVGSPIADVLAHLAYPISDALADLYISRN